MSLVVRMGLLALLTIFSLAILYTTFQNSLNARRLAEQALESKALALSAAAENALTARGRDTAGELRAILSDRVVAYALIAGRDGGIIYHSNERLAGTKLAAGEWIAGDISPGLGRRIILGTGAPAYAFHALCHLPTGEEKILRLVLHTQAEDLIISQADRQWWIVGGILLLLWTLGILLERIFIRQVRLEETLEREKQLGLIGQMSAVLAHEIRNALGSVKGYVQYLDEKTPPSDSRKGIFRLVLQGTDRIESLVGDLLRFSKKEEYGRESVPLKPLLLEALSSVTDAWPGGVEWGETGGAVRADREKLLGILVNGLRNALEAMGPDQGRLRIAVEPKGRWALIHIEDDGPGISPEAAAEAFTPFYTTKATGTGLGLAYAEKLTEGMGGKISLGNRPGKKGAVLTIQLPKG
ncbi:MAG: ATP-binding protein [Smithellaceae bacterium]|nr:ATP-binding protein [Smithellaceae bacterium]